MKDKRLLALGLLTVFSFLVGVNMLLQTNSNTYKSSAASTTLASTNTWPGFIVSTMSSFPTKEHEPPYRSVSDAQTHTGTGYSVKVGSDKSWGAFYVQNLLSSSVTLTFVQDCRENLAGFEQCPGWKPGLTATQLKALKKTQKITIAGNQIVSVYVGVQCWPYQLDINSPFSHGRNIPSDSSKCTTVSQSPPPTTITPPTKTPTPPTKTPPPPTTITPRPPAISCDKLTYGEDNPWGPYYFNLTAKDPNTGNSMSFFAYRIQYSSGAEFRSGFMSAGQRIEFQEISADTFTAYVAPATQGTTPKVTGSYVTSRPSCQYSFGGITPPTQAPKEISCTSITPYGVGERRFTVKTQRSSNALDEVYYVYITKNGSRISSYQAGGIDTGVTYIDINEPVTGGNTYKGYVGWSPNGPWTGGNAACTYTSPTDTRLTPPTSTPTKIVSGSAFCQYLTKINPLENKTVTAGQTVALEATVYRNTYTGSYRVMRVDSAGNYLTGINPVVPSTPLQYSGVGGNVNIPFTITQVEPGIYYSYEVNSGTGFTKNSVCRVTYAPAATPTKVTTTVPTPTLAPWRFVGCYQDPHCWRKSASATATPPDWQQWPSPGNTYNTSWTNGRQIALQYTKNGYTTKIEYELTKFGDTPGQIITNVYVNGALISKDLMPVVKGSTDYNHYKPPITLTSDVVLMVNKYNCSLSGTPYTCLNPQIWWREDGTRSGLLETFYNGVKADPYSVPKWPTPTP